jgi:hypothetical protein
VSDKADDDERPSPDDDEFDDNTFFDPQSSPESFPDNMSCSSASLVSSRSLLGLGRLFQLPATLLQRAPIVTPSPWDDRTVRPPPSDISGLSTTKTSSIDQRHHPALSVASTSVIAGVLDG